MKTLLFAVASLALFQQAASCGQKAAPAPKPTKVTFPIHRFDREAAMPLDIALDTLTGQYCKTWDWGYKNPTAVPSADLQHLPTCLQLFTQYPSQLDMAPDFIPAK